MKTRDKGVVFDIIQIIATFVTVLRDTTYRKRLAYSVNLNLDNSSGAESVNALTAIVWDSPTL